MSTYVFSSLYATQTHNLLINVLPQIINFVSKSKGCSKLGFSTTSLYWTLKGLGKIYLTEKILIEAIIILLSQIWCSNKILEYLWVLTLFYFREICFLIFFILSMFKMFKCFKYHATSRFIGDLCAMMTISQNPFKFIYPLKHSGTHATLLDLAIKTEDGILVYKLFDKRDKFRFFIVLMPHFESNIQSTIFYGSIFSEFLCIGQVYTKTGAFSI